MKQRIISAIVAIAICLPIIIHGGKIFCFAAALIGVIGFYEIIKLRANKKEIPLLMKLVSLVLFILITMDEWRFNSEFLLLKDKLVFMLFFILIPIVFYNDKKKYNIDDAFYLIGNIIFLGIGFNTLIITRMSNLNYFIYLTLVVVITDTFAYFTGYFIGKNKLCPKISPKKTWEGFFGGLLFGTLAGVVIYNVLFDANTNILILILITMILSVIGQIGDLVFSSIKRYYDIKDFGNIMPGHGGVLDRIDSLLFVLIAFTYLSRFI